jgi:beta-lactamase regulating signal transducer with metallopeptidase domain
MDPNFNDLLARSSSVAFAADLAVKATLILAAAGAAAMALRRSSAAARHLAWCLGLGAALAMPTLCLALPGWSWRVLPADARTASPTGPTSADSPAAHPGPSGTASPSLDEIAFEQDESLPVAGPSGRLPSPPTAAAGVPSWRILDPSWSWLWGAWLAGGLVVLAAPIAGRIALRRWASAAMPIVDDDWTAMLGELSARLGLSRRVALLRSDRAAMPMTWGWLRPVVLLPAGADSWGVDRRRDVLLHELAHVRRLDCLTQAIARLACAVYWFHPLAWLADRRMQIERERACDDVVLLAGARASEYAGHLLEIARGLRVPRAAARAALAMARPSQLAGRLMAILDPARHRRGPGRRVAAIALCAAVLALVPLATLHLGARAAVPAIAPIADDPPSAGPDARMTVTGRVLDPSGRPVPRAAVVVLVPSKYSERPRTDRSVPTTAHEGLADGSGQFRIDLPRTTSARHGGLIVAALASGFGVGWVELDPDADAPTSDIALRPELIVKGRLFDVQGQPARGVALRVEGIERVARGEELTRLFRPDYLQTSQRELTAWPATVVSDAEGRFVLRGTARGLQILVQTDDLRFQSNLTMLRTDDGAERSSPLISTIQVDPGPDPRPIAIALQPARTIAGRVTYGDTGQPAPQAMVWVMNLQYRADEQGRFRGPAPRVPAERFAVQAQPPDDAPYLSTSKLVVWPKGAVEQSVDIALARGVTIRGKVVEEDTGRPVAGAVVLMTPYPAAPDRPRGMGGPAATGPDGTFRIAAPPGRGYLVVQGPDDDHVLREIGAEGGYLQARPGRRRFYASAYRAVDLKPDEPEQEIDLAVRRGAAVQVRPVAPDGQPIRDAWVYSRIILQSMPAGGAGWKEWRVFDERHRGHARDGRFTLHGLEPDVEVPAYFLEPGRKLGAVARFSGRSAANGPVVVRLEPCGTARARLVGPDGKSLARYPAAPLVSMVIAPGPPYLGSSAKDGPPFAQEESVNRLDPVNYTGMHPSDAQGRVIFPALIPGAAYRIVDYTPAVDGRDDIVRKEFTVKPGETLDLGDILIARPRQRE